MAYGDDGYGYGWRPYVSVAERRRNALRAMEKRRKKGIPVSPVTIEGRTIAKTFWGAAWCQNLERYGDYANRLPRGRTYVRNGSVVDLQVEPGKVKATVSGSELYEVSVTVSPVPAVRWKAICGDCAGTIDSLVELLRGRFEKGVMERLCREREGLFPAPKELKFSCSCPDWASMCKHVAATLYGVGARLDEKPELLFRLRKVSEADLLAGAGSAAPLARRGPAAGRTLAAAEVADVFGIEMDAGPSAAAPATAGTKPPAAAKAKAAVPAKARGKRVPAAARAEPKAARGGASGRRRTGGGGSAR